ncbi:MAG: hypothetical protein OZ921_05610 [Sorangiineae bacterium]|nr:hypothetical protein [Sorangiineae bacterium]
MSARAAAALLIVTACNPPPPAGPRGGEAPAAASPRAAAAAAPSAPPSASTEPLPALLPDGCWSGAEPHGEASAALDALAAACIGGMEPLAGARATFRLGEGESRTTSFTLADESRCVRVAAAAGPGVHELTLAVTGASGRALGASALRASFALMREAGPLCLDAPGEYRATARVTRGAGEVALGVWQAR